MGCLTDLFRLFSLAPWLAGFALEGRLSLETAFLLLLALVALVGAARSLESGWAQGLFTWGVPTASLLSFAALHAPDGLRPLVWPLMFAFALLGAAYWGGRALIRSRPWVPLGLAAIALLWLTVTAPVGAIPALDALWSLLVAVVGLAFILRALGRALGLLR